MTRTMSANAVLALQGFEDCALRPYKNKGDKWTNGWGHTKGVGPSSIITRSQAIANLNDDLADVYSALGLLVKVPTTQGQWDALSDFTFNEGVGHLGSSTLLTLLNARNYIAAGDELIRWKYGPGGVMAGLAKRRGQEFIWWWS